MTILIYVIVQVGVKGLLENFLNISEKQDDLLPETIMKTRYCAVVNVNAFLEKSQITLLHSVSDMDYRKTISTIYTDGTFSPPITEHIAAVLNIASGEETQIQIQIQIHNIHNIIPSERSFTGLPHISVKENTTLHPSH